MSYASEITADAPTAWARLGEASGTSVTDQVGGTAGRYVGGVTLASPGLLASDPSNTAAAMNGSTGYATFADRAAFDLGDVFTLECWVNLTAYRDAAGDPVVFIDKGANAYIVRIANALDGTFILRRNGVATLVTSTARIPLGRPSHVVATKNGSTVKLYLNGVDVTGTVTNNTMTNNSAAFGIGAADITAGPVNGYLPGTIDEVAVYSRALSAARVLAHYTAGQVSVITAFGASAGTGGAAASGVRSAVAAGTSHAAAASSGRGVRSAAAGGVSGGAGAAAGSGHRAATAAGSSAGESTTTGSGARAAFGAGASIAASAGTGVGVRVAVAAGTSTGDGASFAHAGAATIVGAGISRGRGDASAAGVRTGTAAGTSSGRSTAAGAGSRTGAGYGLSVGEGAGAARASRSTFAHGISVGVGQATGAGVGQPRQVVATLEASASRPRLLVQLHVPRLDVEARSPSIDCEVTG